MDQAYMIANYYQRLEAENRSLRRALKVLLVGGTVSWLALVFA